MIYCVWKCLRTVHMLAVSLLDRRCYSKVGKGMVNLVVLGVVQMGVGEAEGKWARRR